MSTNMVSLTIDGRSVSVPKGTLLVEAAKQAGIEIPVFCYHPKLDPAGVCRMCLVMVEKIPKPQTACTTQVSEGMVVHTQNSQVEDLQRGVLEFLLINHPLDCPVCDKGGECDLQDHTFNYGPPTSRLQDGKIKKDKSVELGNFIVLDNERCILCRRCTRFDDEIPTEGNLIIQERGHFAEVTTFEGEEYNSYFSGNTIELCPVGALTSDLYRFKARPWDLAKIDSVCTGCSVGCNVKEEFRHGNLLRLTSRENPAIDDGWLCDRGRFNYKFIQSENRLTQPLIKKDGNLVPATWSEAMNLITERFQAIKGESGGKGFGVIGGGKLTNEEAYLLQKFARVTLGTNNLDHRTSDQVIASLGAYPGRQEDLSNTSTILVLDTNPAETAPVMDLRIRRATDRKKAKVAVIGSVMPKYRGRHERIQTKPGQTAAVVAALTAAVTGTKNASAPGCDADTIKKMAGLLASGPKLVVVWGGNDPGVGRALADLCAALKKSQTSTEAGRSVHVLIPGAQNNSRGAEAMGMLPSLLPGMVSLSDARAREAISATWNIRSLSGDAGLGTAAMLKAAAAGEIQALYLAGANLLNTFPDRKLAQAALETAFVVTAELFLNETALLADVVLPAASISEKSGTYTTLDGLVQSIKSAKKAEGSAQADGDILVALSGALGTKLATTPQQTQWEIAKLASKLEAGAVLSGAPVNLLPANDNGAKTETPAGLSLVAVDRLYAGGSTALFDTEFNHVQPKAEAFFNPADVVRLGIKRGDQVELVVGGSAVQLTAQVEKSVVLGTVQAIKGLPAAPVNSLTSTSGAPVAVTVAKLGVEVAD